MKTFPRFLRLLLVLPAVIVLGAASPCFALMSIAEVTKEEAKKMGMEVRVIASATNPVVRVELEFKAEGTLKNFSRVDLESTDGGKLQMSATLQSEKSASGGIVVGFAADRANLDKCRLRVVVAQQSERSRTGYDLRIKNFVDAKAAENPADKAPTVK